MALPNKYMVAAKTSGCGSTYLLPRELAISNVTGGLLQRPVAELTGLRKSGALQAQVRFQAQV